MRLLAPESLDTPQRTIFEECSRFFPEGSVCVNVVLGREAWDVRPLILTRGSVSLMRLSPRLDETRARQLAGDLEGFARLFNQEIKIQLIADRGQFFIIRPFVADTLQDELEKGLISGRGELERLIKQLIKLVGELSRRSMAHGHLSPANIAVAKGELVLLDPLMGAIQVSTDPFLPPESSLGLSPEPTADLFCLGKMIRTLLGDSLSPRQTSVVEQLLLPSPRHRPPLAEVAVAFGLHEGTAAPLGAEQAHNGSRTNAGKLVRSAGTSTANGTRSGVADVWEETEDAAPQSNRGWLLIPLALVVGVYLIKERYPSLYYSLATRVPGLVSEHSVEFESEWASHQKPRMLVVARSAILRDDPAAMNAITADILGGANPEGVRSRLLRVALDELWRDQLSQTDVRSAVALALIQMFPEGARTLPALKTLHPAILLAIAGETQPLNPGKELQSISLDSLTTLPAPFGVLFTEIEKLGVSKVGHPAAIGLAANITDRASIRAMLDRVALAYGGFDSICVTAGVFVPSDTSGHIPDDKWALTFNINVTGSYLVGDEASITWKEQGLRGNLVLTTSANAVVAKKGSVAYDCSKAAANHLVRELSIELSPLVRVNGVAPATVVQGSAMFPRDRVIGSLAKYNIPYTDDEATESLVRKLAQFYADRTLTKSPITPADQAEAYFLLISQRLSKTTGQVITVDGGLHEAFLR